MRGKHERKGNYTVVSRITPACAGKTPVFALFLLRFRITPACAGKTTHGRTAYMRSSDHPRVCGENETEETVYVAENGSPPRVRGKQHHLFNLKELQRITPACAGKTRQRLYRPFARTDHPRVCGENLADILLCELRGGSPPRVRGKHDSYPRAHVRLRITPACAGKTAGLDIADDIVSDHPRVCGENRFQCRHISAPFGSPPRVRGKLELISSKSLPPRITPACAGKTRSWQFYGIAFTDHPRVCGENREVS